MPVLESALRESPCFYKSERRRAIGDRIQELEEAIERGGPTFYVLELDEELERRRAALEPLTLAESWEDVGYAFRGLIRQIWQSLRA